MFRLLNNRKVYIRFSVIDLVRPMEVKDKIQAEKIRKMRAFAIISKGDMPQKKDTDVFVMPSQSDAQKTYTVHKEHGEWHCTCPDHKETGLLCKHIQAVTMWLTFEENQDDDVLTLKAEIDHPQCPECGSYEVIKKGYRKTKSGKRQKYRCKNCEHYFVPEPIKHRKANTKIIALCIDLYYKGLSLRKIADTLEQFYDLSIHHDTVRVWIDTFMDKITEYVNRYNPDLGAEWNIDEQKVKSDGEWVYAWNVMDKKTRFLVANTITEQRSILETRKVMRKATGQTETRPDRVVTDGMTAYPAAVKDMFPTAEHIHNAGIRDAVNNNTLERYHGTFRERDKVMRGLKSNDTAENMVDHYRTYYNFIRGHTSLNGQTPAEQAGINLTDGKNRWMGLLEKSLSLGKTTGGIHASNL